jgi:anti-sigma factor RsiW
MTCERVRQLLSDYLDGELSSAVTTRVQSHLYGCPACEREHQALRRTVQLLATQGRQRIPVDCRDLVLARLREESLMPPVSPSRSGWWRAFLPDFSLAFPTPGLARATAMAGVALLCLGGAWIARNQQSEQPSPQLAAIGQARPDSSFRPVSQSLTPEEDLTRFHAPTSIGQAMGRDNGIILVSDWVESP